jgi:uncharacterized membrane protein
VVARVWPADRVEEQLEKQIHRAFRIGNGRTPTQDVEYAVNQLTEMAVRAMSPAINDPFTAMTCLDHIGNGLVKFIQQSGKGSHYYDRDGRLRLVLEPVTFDDLLSAAFDMLRHASCNNASVLLRILKSHRYPWQGKRLRRQALLHRQPHPGGKPGRQLIEQDRHAIDLSSQALRTKLAGAA